MSNVILIIVMSFFLIILIKLQHVFFYSPDLYNINKDFLQKNRGKIFDRNGELIATNIDTKDFYLDTRRVLDKNNLKIKLKKIFPYKNDTYFENIFSKKQYIKIKKYLTVNEQNQLKKVGDPGIMLHNSTKRIYLQHNLFSHLTGFKSSELNKGSTFKNIQFGLINSFLDPSLTRAPNQFALEGIEALH